MSEDLVQINDEEKIVWIDSPVLFTCPDGDAVRARVASYFNKQRTSKKKQKEPLAVLVYGLSGSGKSTMLSGPLLRRSVAGYDQCVIIDSAILEDPSNPPGLQVRAKDVRGTKLGCLSGYTIRSMAAFGNCTSLAEKEYDEGLDKLIDDKYSIAIHLHSGVPERLIEMRAAGYRTVLVWLETNPEKALDRAARRAKKNGLFLSADYQRSWPSLQKERKRLFKGYAHLADAWMIVDNNEKQAKLADFSSKYKDLIVE